ncbi:MAG: peptide chain release factor N(5)-glutamine methyltransferase [Anaerolineales bacterium]|nr:peptide chain release factor N(5)-glutamine methyltransferase [Anaerolineales bacterium]
MNIKEFLESQKNLVDDFDAQVLLAHVLEISRPQLIANLNTPLDLIQLDSATQLFAQLQAGTPLPYILGHWEFFGLDFEINEHVLIPRPETELLVEKAIAYLKNNSDKRNVIDVGTGSGIIAISIAKHIPDAKILATDISPKALQVAKQNATKHGVENQIEFIECDLLPKSQVTGQKSDDLRLLTCDLICANLPYIPTKTLQGLEIYGKEPTLALDGGEDGLGLYRKLFGIVSNNNANLNALFWLCEVEETQGSSSKKLAKEFFPNAKVNLHQDLSGRDRLIEIIL